MNEPLTANGNSVALLLIDHGSRIDAANRMLEDVADLARRTGRFHFVAAAHMELAHPTIAEGLAACVASGAEQIVAAPYFLSPGRHSSEDIPALVARAAPPGAAGRIVVAEPLGLHGGLIDAVGQRAQEALTMRRRQPGIEVVPSLADSPDSSDSTRRPQSIFPIRREDAALIVIDIQDSLVPRIFNHETMMPASAYLIRLMRMIGVPVFVTEQYPERLGVTSDSIQAMLGEDYRPLEKMSFSAWAVDRLRESIPAQRKTLVLCGMETHICVAQTAQAALRDGYRVVVAADAVGAQHEINHRYGLERMREAGAVWGASEMIVYEMLEKAGTEEFRALLPVLRNGPFQK